MIVTLVAVLFAVLSQAGAFSPFKSRGVKYRNHCQHLYHLGLVSIPTTTSNAAYHHDWSLLRRSAHPQLGGLPALLPKYPTLRGSELDARKIIATGVGRQYLTAVRMQHILLLTEEMAVAQLNMLRSSNNNMMRLDELAPLVSACTVTRNKGGAIGWVSVQEDTDDNKENNFTSSTTNELVVEQSRASAAIGGGKNSHLDDILPREAREQVILITTKPGDICLVPSRLGFHLVQIVDVMADVHRMATLRPRRIPKTANGTTTGSSSRPLPRAGVLSGVLLDGTTTAHDLTYKIETMERIEGQLQSLGIRPHVQQPRSGNLSAGPDVVVLNTCSIRDHAEQKVYSYLGPYVKRKRQGDDVVLIVAGCVAQQEGQALLRRIPEIDLVMGPQYANRMADLLEDVAHGNQVVATEATHIMEDATKPRRQSIVAAWVNVIYGCNERCTFCIVPTTRGVEQSRPVESIVHEVQELVAQGFKEVTLLGQNVDAYGRDMMPKRKFSDLIRTVGSVAGLERLRFVTSHPRYMSLGVVDAVAETPAACESFHIPFQSGSNTILAVMGRGHTREKYLHIVERIRSVRGKTKKMIYACFVVPFVTKTRLLCRICYECPFSSQLLVFFGVPTTDSSREYLRLPLPRMLSSVFPERPRRTFRIPSR
jgi:MiaB/RimO family radical SAM methylthiotransferase